MMDTITGIILLIFMGCMFCGAIMDKSGGRDYDGDPDGE